jgi:hypothetical protein
MSGCPIGSSNGSSTGAAAVGVAAGVGIFKVYFLSSFTLECKLFFLQKDCQ